MEIRAWESGPDPQAAGTPQMGGHQSPGPGVSLQRFKSQLCHLLAV